MPRSSKAISVFPKIGHKMGDRGFAVRVCTTIRVPSYQAIAVFACSLLFAQRLLSAFEIFAFAAADITLFFTRVRFRLVDLPRARAADCKPLKSYCNLATCFCSV